MVNITIILLFLAFYQKTYSWVLNTCPGNNLFPPPHNREVPEVGLSATELIRFYGYTVESHNVETTDGYILTMHRIPSPNKPPVLVMHGYLCSSADWVNMGSNASLAYILAREGYDVWLGNARGNTYSRKHISLNPNKDEAYWTFSWHEIGVFDLPAKIDYILAQTKQDSLYYIGHSQGTTAFFVMASERPDYNRKIRYMGALAPVVFVEHVKNYFFQLMDPLDILEKVINLHNFLPNCWYLQYLTNFLCQDGMLTQDICANILFSVNGYHKAGLNYTRLPVIFTNFPAGVSSKQGLHYEQMRKSGRFCQYDFGPDENLLIYGEATPSEYNLSAITSPVGLYYGPNDRFAGLDDIRRLQSKLRNVFVSYLVPDDQFNHIDFLWGINVPNLVYKPLISDMKYTHVNLKR